MFLYPPPKGRSLINTSKIKGDWEGRTPPKEECLEKAEKFWKTAKIYEPGETEKEWQKTHEGTVRLSMPEVWCPCRIPKTAIAEKFDKSNPPSDKY